MGLAVHDSGLPVPDVGDIIRVYNRNGLLYERIDGRSMWELLKKRPWSLFSFACRTAELHAGMQGNSIHPDIPSQRRRLEKKLNNASALPEDLLQYTLDSLSSLPDGKSICHGDFHPHNI